MFEMKNLLEETIKELQENGKDESMVKWCGTKNLRFSWSKFKELADVNYDSGFGSTEVAVNLVVVGEDWWLERGEYDGSEWWVFKSFPKSPVAVRAPLKLIGENLEKTLEEINGWEKENISSEPFPNEGESKFICEFYSAVNNVADGIVYELHDWNEEYFQVKWEVNGAQCQVKYKKDLVHRWFENKEFVRKEDM